MAAPTVRMHHLNFVRRTPQKFRISLKPFLPYLRAFLPQHGHLPTNNGFLRLLWLMDIGNFFHLFARSLAQDLPDLYNSPHYAMFALP